MVIRKNEKEILINYENSIKKSNELSMAKLSHGLSLNQMQLLAFAIYSTQQNGVTEFNKADFEKKFDLEKYNTKDAKKDAVRLLDLKVSMEDLANDKFKFWNVFMGMEYYKGLFKFDWNPNMIPHILELKDKYITTDFATQSKFKSSFTWTLYDFLKANYGYWHKIIAKDTLMRLFCVENVKSYQKNTGDFKKLVLNTAIEEINKYTELEVWYKEIKKGRSIVAFDIYWTNGNQKSSATEKQIVEIQSILDVVFDDVFRYVNLKNDDDREHAIELIRELEGYREYIVEPICITKEFAHTLLIKANSILKELEYLKEQNNKPEGHRIYNWLEEKE